MVHDVFNDGELAPNAGPVLTPEWIGAAADRAADRALSTRRRSVDCVAGQGWKPCCGFLPQAGKAKSLTCSIGPAHPFLKLA
jgi:hypothetical protein